MMRLGKRSLQSTITPMQRMLFLLFGALFISSFTRAQELNTAIGQWRSHLPYQAGPYVTQSADQIFYGTEWSVMSIDKVDRAVNFLDKIDGLSNIGIASLQYHRGQKILVIAYENSVLDLVRADGSVETMNQIANFTNFVGERSITQMVPDSDSTLLVAATYGLSRINLNRVEFDFTTFGVPVDHLARYQGFLYAATEEGLYRVAETEQNPQNLGNWTLLGPDEGFPFAYSTRDLVVANGRLYLDLDGEVYTYDGQNLTFFHDEEEYNLEYMSAEGSSLLIGYRPNSGSGGRLVYFDKEGNAGQAPGNCFGQPNYAVEDEQGRIWMADRFRDFRILNSLQDESCQFLSFNSPWSENNRDMAIRDGEVWMAAGGVTQQFTYRFLDHGFASLIDGQWRIFNRNTVEAMKGPDPNSPDDDLYDIIDVAIRPDDGMVFAASFLEGLLQYDGETITQYDNTNSSLRNAQGDVSRTRVTGLAFDESNNLWIANHTAERPVSVFTRAGEWQSFRPSCGIGEIHQVDVDLNGYKWFVSNSNSVGLVVFDSGDLSDNSDDRCRIFNQNNSNLPTNLVNCVTTDLDGDVWVGTGEGIVIFECGSGVFEPNCQGTLRVFTEDEFNDYLLANEDVQAIAVDGANRKWVGTRNGIFVLSPDGEDELLRFTADNSPLPDDNIIDIAINDDNGEVFIGTDNGIVSYRAEATGAGRLFAAEVNVFPNPVAPEYRGPITIKGLARDAIVKITDINGRLVYETEALGGQAIWDGTDYNGRRANSGVYLVFAASNSRTSGFGEPGSAIARILFIRGDGQ